MRHILVVDDNEDSLNLTKTFLSHAGHLVTTAKEAFTAFEKIKTHQFDLIITDINMPHRNGFDFVSGLRKHRALHPVPIIFMSARNSNQDILRGLGAGGDDYLVKPITKETLLTKVDKQFQKKQFSIQEAIFDESQETHAKLFLEEDVVIESLSKIGIRILSAQPILELKAIRLTSPFFEKIGLAADTFETMQSRKVPDGYEIFLKFKNLSDSDQEKVENAIKRANLKKAA